MDRRLFDADEIGVRLELVAGLPMWEPSPPYRHQKAVDRIRASFRPGTACEEKHRACVHLANVYIAFPDGSLKRPDVSVFSCEPEADDEPIRLVPEAVIEVISKGYEARDLQVGPQFYLALGVKDVVVFSPYSLAVLHFRRDGAKSLLSPTQTDFECGCRCTV